MVRRLFVAITVTIVLIGCGAAPAEPAAVAPTSAPAAAPTATPVPLDQVDLESILIASGDLPAGMSGAQVRDTAPKMFDGMPPAIKVINQQIAQDERQIGGVTVFLYADAAEREKAYKLVLDGFGDAKAVEDLGEQAQITLPDDGTVTVIDSADVAFVRCQAVAHVRMTGAGVSKDTTPLTAYAKRLDKRLATALGC